MLPGIGDGIASAPAGVAATGAAGAGAASTAGEAGAAGAAGISAFPMSSRVIQKMATDEDPQNFILMYAVGANVSGQIASVIAGGLLLSFFM